MSPPYSGRRTEPPLRGPRNATERVRVAQRVEPRATTVTEFVDCHEFAHIEGRGPVQKEEPDGGVASKHRVAAAFVDAHGWDVDLSTGVVHTVIGGVTVTAMLNPSLEGQIGVLIEAGAQAERTLANTFGDDDGDPFDFDGWPGTAAPGSGLIDANAQNGPELHDKVVAAATHLVQQIS